MTSTRLCMVAVAVCLLAVAYGQVFRRKLRPGHVFLSCCMQQEFVPSACYKYCTYIADQDKGFGWEGLKEMYENRTACPFEALGSYLFCAGQGEDQREACTANGVAKVANGICTNFCDLRAGGTLHLRIEHLICRDTLDLVRKTFKQTVQHKIDNGFYDPPPPNGEIPDVPA